jgi:hypothetical protein
MMIKEQADGSMLNNIVDENDLMKELDELEEQ